jgi:ABC-type transport system involved in multi-copper enzyme maturation permease subunit
MTASRIAAVARLDFGEVLRSRWLPLCLGIYALLGGAFVWVGLRESSVLGFTGMGRVLFSLCHALVVVLPLLALLATSQTVNRAREDGSLELLLTQPIGRGDFLAGVTLVRALALALPLVAVIGALGLLGGLVRGQAVPWPFVARALAVSVALVAAFVGVGIALSVAVRNPARATTVVLLVWAAGVLLLDFSGIALLLRWQLPPRAVFLLAAANPVQAARLALLAAAEPELATLGPVGLWLATRVGHAALFGLGVVWPLLLGLVAWSAALFAFRRGDAV